MASTDPRNATQAQWEDLVARIKAKADTTSIGNATLTIQKNSTSVGTFTANASTDSTINITVPTTAADVSALPSSTKYAAAIDLSINSSTYVVTAQLKDQDGNNLGSAQTIDLPLESMVVSGSYDDQTKKIILTLQSGSTVEFSVADLVSGLQTELSATNKLNADYIDYSNSANKAAITGTGAPTTSTVGSLGQIYVDKSTGKLYVCTAVTTNPDSYTWTEYTGNYQAGANITISGNTISATDTTYSAFTGADGSTAGTAGLVPAPAAGDNTKFLGGDGTWKTVSVYNLPIASANDLGGIKVGSGLSINSSTGVLTADTQAAAFTTNEWNALWA